MLEKVKRPDGAEVSFKYDALGRRIEKKFRSRITRWVWDGNIPLHEQRETFTQDYSEEKGYFENSEKEPIITGLFDEGTFVPAAKLTENKKISIVTNYLGTPEAMYDETGQTAWNCQLNSYGKVRTFTGEYKTDCPFRYQGQYEDAETGLYYNRFRYYSPEEGIYIYQDPVRLNGGTAFYGYVLDTNIYIDSLGLSWGDILIANGEPKPTTMDRPHGHHIVFKGQFENDARGPYIDRSKAVLDKYDIDINDPANLMWAPNVAGVHTADNAEKVASKLEEADKMIQEQVDKNEMTKEEAQNEMKCKLQQTGKSVFG